MSTIKVHHEMTCPSCGAETFPGSPALVAEVARLKTLLTEAMESIDVLAEDSEELGYSNRAGEACDLSMRIRAALRGERGA